MLPMENLTESNRKFRAQKRNPIYRHKTARQTGFFNLNSINPRDTLEIKLTLIYTQKGEQENIIVYKTSTETSFHLCAKIFLKSNKTPNKFGLTSFTF